MTRNGLWVLGGGIILILCASKLLKPIGSNWMALAIIQQVENSQASSKVGWPPEILQGTINPRTRNRLMTQKALYEGDYISAKNIVDQEISETPNNNMILVLAARINEKLGLYDLSIDQLLHAGAFHYLKVMGDNLAGQGEWAKASRAYQAYLTLRPMDCSYMINFGYSIWRETGDGLAAIEQYQKAIYVCPGDINGYIAISRVFVDMKKFTDAEEYAHLALSIDSTSELPYNILGLSLLRQNKPNEALLVLEKAISVNPSSAEAHEFLGSAYIDLSQYDEAIKELQEAIKLNPKRIWSYIELGRAFVKLSDYKNAIIVYRQALNLDPMNSAAQEGINNLSP